MTTQAHLANAWCFQLLVCVKYKFQACHSTIIWPFCRRKISAPASYQSTGTNPTSCAAQIAAEEVALADVVAADEADNGTEKTKVPCEFCSEPCSLESLMRHQVRNKWHVDITWLILHCTAKVNCKVKGCRIQISNRDFCASLLLGMQHDPFCLDPRSNKHISE